VARSFCAVAREAEEEGLWQEKEREHMSSCELSNQFSDTIGREGAGIATVSASKSKGVQGYLLDTLQQGRRRLTSTEQ